MATGQLCASLLTEDGVGNADEDSGELANHAEYQVDETTEEKHEPAWHLQ